MIKTFNRRQWTVIVLWVAIVMVGGGLLRRYGYFDFSKIADTLLEVSVPLMGFVLTTIAIISSVLGSTLLKRLKENGAYDSLINNLYYLLISLFVGSVSGVVLRHVDYKNLSLTIFVDFVILLLIAIIFILFWYATTRFARMMKHVDD